MNRLGDVVNQAVLLLLGFLSLFPIYFTLVNSVKNPEQYARNAFNLPNSPYVTAVLYSYAQRHKHCERGSICR